MRYAKNVRFKVERTGTKGKTRTSVHRKKTTAMEIVNKAVRTGKPVMIEAVKVKAAKKKKK